MTFGVSWSQSAPRAPIRVARPPRFVCCSLCSLWRRAALTHPPSSAPRQRFLAATCTPATSYELVAPLPPCGGYSAHTSLVFIPTPPTPKLPPAALGGTSSALRPQPCGYVWSSGAPEHGNGTSLHPPVVGAHVDGPGWLDLHARGVGRVDRRGGGLARAGRAETA